MSVHVSSRFDSGNIEVLSTASAGQSDLAIRADPGGEFRQWFHFRATGRAGVRHTFRILNAGQTSYPKGWQDYRVVWSADGEQWQRHDCRFADGVLEWSMQLPSDVVHFACFAPYSQDRVDQTLMRVAARPGVAATRLGQTIDSRDITMLTLSARPGERAAADRRVIWAIGRQHPGESMASWWMEGWLDRLTDPNDATAGALRRTCDIHVVPNMNPDGVFEGYLRTNAAGVNLNRQWADPDRTHCPEVWHVREAMRRTGVDLSLDIHGDEILPYNFIAGTHGIADWNARREAQLAAFKTTVAALNPDFQTTHGYPPARPGEGNPNLCSNHVAQHFGALAMTLEMPFTDTRDTPDPDAGWSPERCIRLGATFVDACWLMVSDRLLAPV